MLTQIYIRDLATIAELQLNLQTGSTMITGETGAGKSIFIEAIELALGGRSSANVVRHGKDKAEISLCFDITHFPRVIESLQHLDMYHDSSECIIRRIITADGRSRCYVNGTPATLQFVKELGEYLFHLHGQHEQQVLLKSDTQREMLDRFGDHLALANQVKHAAEKWKSLEQQIHDLHEQARERTSRMEYLRFQLDELDNAQLQEGEWEVLEETHHRLTHTEELMRNIQIVLQQISEDESRNLLAALNEVRRTLDAILLVEPKASAWMESINSAIIQMEDLVSELQNYAERAELDPQKLQTVEARISQIFNLSRKYKIQPVELVALQKTLSHELSMLNSSDENLLKLTHERDAITKEYQSLASTLSALRKKAAVKLAKEMTATIRSLSLPHGEFKVELEPVSAHDILHAHGLEKIIFLIKTNPDQSMQPLAKVISGGELSRLSLAAHLALANRTNIPTLVFDEVDTGLSGATAEKIGKLLRTLGHSYQVFCVTHQPQVAACGHQQLLVEKYFVERSTYTRLRLLNADERTAEIARMLGGEKITEKTLEHAREVLEGA